MKQRLVGGAGWDWGWRAATVMNARVGCGQSRNRNLKGLVCHAEFRPDV